MILEPQPLIITQHGEAKMVIMDIGSFEREQETMALLKLLLLGEQEWRDGEYQEAAAFFAEMDQD